jgi:hypothetical protein
VISDLLALISHGPADDIVFIGGTTLARTHLRH